MEAIEAPVEAHDLGDRPEVEAGRGKTLTREKRQVCG
jgi:hypothetical protein